MEVMEAPLEQPGELLATRLAVHDRLERLTADGRIGHARVRELADVRRDPVELVERQPPRGGPGPSRDYQRAVDIEQDGDAVGGHAAPNVHWTNAPPNRRPRRSPRTHPTRARSRRTPRGDPPAASRSHPHRRASFDSRPRPCRTSRTK